MPKSEGKEGDSTRIIDSKILEHKVAEIMTTLNQRSGRKSNCELVGDITLVSNDEHLMTAGKRFASNEFYHRLLMSGRYSP